MGWNKAQQPDPNGSQLSVLRSALQKVIDRSLRVEAQRPMRRSAVSDGPGFGKDLPSNGAIENCLLWLIYHDLPIENGDFLW